MKIDRRLITCAVLWAWLVAGWATPAGAGIYWESTQTTRSMPGQKDGTRIVKNYLSPYGSRTELENLVLILNIENNSMYQIDPQKQTYSKIDLAAMGQKMPGMDADAPPEMRELMEKMMGDPQVTPTPQTRTINGYACRKYLVNFMMAESEYWLSSDIPAAREARELGSALADALGRNPMLKQMNVAAMFKDLDGFPVETTVRVMQGQVTTTVIKIEQKELAADLFRVPPGYREVAAPAP